MDTIWRPDHHKRLGLYRPDEIVVLSLPKGDVLKVLENPFLENPSFLDHFRRRFDKD